MRLQNSVYLLSILLLYTLQDGDFNGPMTNAFGNSTNSSMNIGYGGSSDQPIDVNAIILDWMKQIKNFY